MVEQKMKQVLDSISNIAFLMDRQGVILEVNKHFRNGCQDENRIIIGEHITRFVERKVFNHIINQWSEVDKQVPFVAFEGKCFETLCGVSDFSGWGFPLANDSSIFCGIIHIKSIFDDVCASKSEALISVLSKISVIFASEKNLDFSVTMRKVLKEAAEVLEFDRCYVYGFDEHYQQAHLLYDWTKKEVVSVKNSNEVLPFSALEPYLLSYQKDELIVINDVSMLADGFAKDLMLEAQVGCLIAAPLIMDGVRIGLLGLDTRKPRRRVNQMEMRLLSDLAFIVSSVLANQRLGRLLDISEGKLTSLIDDMHEVLYTLQPDLTVTYISKNVVALFGYTKEEIVGRRFTDFLDSNYYKHIDDIPWANIKNRDDLELCFRAKNGASVWVKTRIRMHMRGSEVMYSQGILYDITESKIKSEALAKSEERYRLLVTQMQDGLAIFDVVFNQNDDPVDLHYVDINDAYARITGLSHSIIGKNLKEVLPNVESYWIERLSNVAMTQVPTQFEDFNNDLNRWFRVSVYSIQLNQCSIIVEDITEQKERLKEVEYLSYHDALTGLYNRYFIDESITRLDTLRNYPFALIMLDVNGMKEMNDTHGHAQGDVLLKEYANQLRMIFREDDIIGRMGGDEFIVLLPKTSKKDVEQLLSRLDHIHLPSFDGQYRVSVAHGFAIKSVENQDIRAVLVEADNRMYEHKRFMKQSAD